MYVLRFQSKNWGEIDYYPSEEFEVNESIH